jgi:hypothetical protein
MGIPIFFCERTGREHFIRGYECPNGHEFERRSAKRGWPGRKLKCPTCASLSPCRSLSTFTEMRRVDTGETFARQFDLPPGAVYADWDQYGDDDNPHNWTNAPDAEGRRYGPPVVTASSASCAALLPAEWKQGVAGAPLPDGNSVGDWIAFGDAQTGKLDQANGRTKDAIGIVERCEARDQHMDLARHGLFR